MKEAKGFTLIELMIVVAIIGIIAAIGYPSYQESTAKARRADATGALMGLSSAMERMYTQNNNYLGLAAAGADDGAPAATVFPSEAPIDGTTKFYDLTMDAADDGQSYVLTATAKNGMLGDRCGNFTLSSAGTRATSTGDAGCWR